jgi:hypothetical protein
MSTLSQIDSLIDHSVFLEGRKYAVAYDSTLMTSYGLWICKCCKSSFFGGGDPIHLSGCSLKGRRVSGIWEYNDENLVYVVGPKTREFKKEEIEKIKKFAP